MQFQQHETKQDLSNEQEIARAIEQKWNCHANKLPKHYRCDFVLTRAGNVVAFAEVKCRSIPHNRYRNVILGLKKVTETNALAREAGVPAYFVIRFTDGTYYTDINRAISYAVTYGGQTVKMRDSRDMEPTCNIPISNLRPL